MIEKPTIAEEAISSALHRGYGITPVTLDFLPIGYDATAWVYRVETQDNGRFFLKLKKGAPRPAMLAAPNYLKSVGGIELPAPIASLSGDLTAPVNPEYILILYPFIDAKNGGRDGMTPDHWENFGRQLSSIHRLTLSPTVIDLLPQETFTSHKLQLFLNNRTRAESANPRDDYEAKLIALWERHADDITRCYDRMLALGQDLKAQSMPKILCHADCHPYNLMVRDDGTVLLIDWDEVIYAPKERDLMFIGSWAGDDDSPAAQAFYRGYGVTDVNRHTIAYYRYEWAIQEFAEYSDVIFFRTDFGDETKQSSLNGFAALFSPGNVVAAAYRDDLY